jgi:hypothetical protein
MGDDVVAVWLEGFSLDSALRPHVHAVVMALPEVVRADLVGDPLFVMCDYEPRRGEAYRVPVGRPSINGVCRSVVFKRTLGRRPVPFIRWLIAHELAHAHLRNEGRFDGEDAEEAADALAAQWGFGRP